MDSVFYYGYICQFICLIIIIFLIIYNKAVHFNVFIGIFIFSFIVLVRTFYKLFYALCNDLFVFGSQYFQGLTIFYERTYQFIIIQSIILIMQMLLITYEHNRNYRSKKIKI